MSELLAAGLLGRAQAIDDMDGLRNLQRDIGTFMDAIITEGMSVSPAEAKLQAEVERLRGLVRTAYAEGFVDACNAIKRPISKSTNCWTKSDTFKALAEQELH